MRGGKEPYAYSHAGQHTPLVSSFTEKEPHNPGERRGKTSLNRLFHLCDKTMTNAWDKPQNIPGNKISGDDLVRLCRHDHMPGQVFTGPGNREAARLSISLDQPVFSCILSAEMPSNTVIQEYVICCNPG